MQFGKIRRGVVKDASQRWYPRRFYSSSVLKADYSSEQQFPLRFLQHPDERSCKTAVLVLVVRWVNSPTVHIDHDNFLYTVLATINHASYLERRWYASQSNLSGYLTRLWGKNMWHSRVAEPFSFRSNKHELAREALVLRSAYESPEDRASFYDPEIRNT